MTLLLNEAYQTLMDDNLRTAYNTAHSFKQAIRGSAYKTFTGSPYSTWVGPDRPQGIFVDENVCVGMASAFMPIPHYPSILCRIVSYFLHFRHLVIPVPFPPGWETVAIKIRSYSLS